MLVVDDDEDMLAVIQGVLEDHGLAVVTARDGREAVGAAERETPDLLILDVTLPVLSSTSVAERMREMSGAPLPVLVITADGHARQKATQLGAYRYLRKPFDLTDLLDAVWLGLRARSAD